MKSFLKHSLVFLLPVVLMAIVIEIGLRDIPNSFSRKRAQVIKLGNNIETLILGSSHTLYGLNPEYLDTPAYNLSQISQTPSYDLAVFKHFETELPNVKRLIVRLSYATLFEVLEDGPERWRAKDYEIYYELATNSSYKNKLEVTAIPFSENIDRLTKHYIHKEKDAEISTLGWSTKKPTNSASTLEKTGPITAKKHTARDFTHLQTNRNALEALINICKNKDIDVVLLTLPAYVTYRSHLDQKQLHTMYQTGKLLAAKYSNVNYLSYLDHPSFRAEDFFDSDHLNEKGAKKLSLLMNNYMNR